MSSDIRATVICADAHATKGFATFNPNEWSGESRGVVQSCASEIGVHFYTTDRIASMCESGGQLCASQFAQLQEQWRVGPWDLAAGRYFVQVPDLHVLIQAFFAGLKSILDLLVQLLSTEGVVRVKGDGFHRKGTNFGGAVLNVLEHNALKGREDLARVLHALLVREKAAWIDQGIRARDLLVHPRECGRQSCPACDASTARGRPDHRSLRGRQNRESARIRNRVHGGSSASQLTRPLQPTRTAPPFW